MLKWLTYVAILGLSVFALGAQSPMVNGSDETIARIWQKYRDVYRTCDGVRIRQHINVEVVESKTAKTLETRKIRMLREEYFYREPLAAVEKCVINGQEQDCENCRGVVKKPIIPVLDEEGHKNYRLENRGVTFFEGDTLLRISVTPRKRTERHFIGDLYFTPDSLELRYRVGTIGKLGLPLKELKMHHTVALIDNVPVTMLNKTDVRLHVPLLYQDRWFKSTTRATDFEVLKK